MSKELIGSHSVHETLVRQTQIDAARIEELERELECERIRLAACGVAAVEYFALRKEAPRIDWLESPNA